MIKEKQALADYLSIWHFDNDLLVYRDGSLGAALKIQGQDITNSNNEEINAFTMSLENFINSIPDGFRIQIFYRLMNKVDEVIKTHKDLSSLKERVEEDEDRNYTPLANARITLLKDNAISGRYFKPEIYYFIRGKSQNYSQRKLWKGEEHFKSIGKGSYEIHRDNFLKNFNQIESALLGCGLKVKRLSEQNWFDLVYEYFNLSRSEKIAAPLIIRGINKFSGETGNVLYEFAPTLPDKVILSDLSVMKDRLEIGDYNFQVITLKCMPELTYSAMMEKFLKVPFNFWLSINFEILDQKKEMERLKLKRRITHSFSNENDQLKDLESESKLGHIEHLISELLESTEKIVAVDMSVVTWSKSEKELDEISYEVLRNFKELGQSEGLIENYPCFEIFMKSWPGSCEGIAATRANKMKSSNLAHLMPIYAYWEGNDTPVCLLPNRNRTLVGIDPFDSKLPNWNGLVVGSSGSGKSFTLSQLILMFIGQVPKPKIVWIDNGASSKNIVETLNGQYIDLNLDSGICLNIFDLEDGEFEPSPSKVKLILAVLETILSEKRDGGLPKLDKAYLEEAIFQVYFDKREKGGLGPPTLSDFRELLLKHESPVLRKWAQVLYSWTGKTAYGKMLDAPTNISLEKNLVSVEIKGLDVYPELQNVFLFLLTDFFKREAAKDPKQKYLLILDEAWRLFESESGAAFAVEAYRTFRKYNAGIWSISQNIHDFLGKEDIAKAVLQNTPSRIILKQRGIDWKDFQKILDLKEIEIEIIKSLRQEKGKYSEFYFLQDQNSTILMLEPDQLSYWICTTDPMDKVKISEFQRENPNLNGIDLFVEFARSVGN
ncbi:MAG: ATP-binding protein [Oligoflexia bacterium]|nr:ATP-binding protein [Oligoflexia bacterium]